MTIDKYQLDNGLANDFYAFINMPALMIKIAHKFPTTRELEMAFRENDPEKSMDAFLKRFSITTPDGKQINDLETFRSCLILVNSKVFEMLNEATSDEHEFQHAFDLLGTPAGLYFFSFFTQEMDADIHFLNSLSRRSKVEVPLMRWLESKESSGNKELRNYLSLRQLNRCCLNKLISTRPIQVKKSIIQTKKENQLFLRLKDYSTQYVYSYSIIPLNNNESILLPINIKSIMECKALLKQLCIISDNLGPVLACLFIVHLLKNIIPYRIYLAPLIPYLYLIGLSNENTNLLEITADEPNTNLITPDIIDIIYTAAEKLAHDLSTLYELCDWALMGDFSSFTTDKPVDYQRTYWTNNEPGTRFAIALEETFKLSNHKKGARVEESEFGKLEIPREFRTYNLNGIVFGIKHLKSLDVIINDQNTNEFTRSYFKNIQYHATKLLEIRKEKNGALLESSFNLYNMVVLMDPMVAYQTQDELIYILNHPEMNYDIGELLWNISLPAYFSKLVTDFSYNEKTICPEDECRYQEKCCVNILPTPPDNFSCMFGKFVKEFFSDVNFCRFS